jgi:Ala-tRNA(Pro) deacylase
VNENLLFDFLDEHNVEYQLFEHQPVFTIDDNPVVTAVDGVKILSGKVPLPHFKTLFLRDKKGLFFLVSITEEKHVDLKALSVELGCNKFSFGKEKDLLDLLKLTPGSVTPYGLLFDQQKKVTFILDEDALKNSTVGFHPLRNDMTIITSSKNFLMCMKKMEHQPHIVRIPLQKS